MFGPWYVDLSIFAFILVLVILMLMIRNEHQRLHDPYAASFVRAKPRTWRWHVERFVLMAKGGIPKRS